MEKTVKDLARTLTTTLMLTEKNKTLIELQVRVMLGNIIETMQKNNLISIAQACDMTAEIDKL